MNSNWISDLLVKLIMTIRYLSGQNEPEKLPGYPVVANSTPTFPQLVAKQGYTAEEHKVTTEDGYILTMFRIPRGRKCNGTIRSPPVLLVHGVVLSADIFIDAGPNDGLGYLVADDCYDTWFGNVRGTFYSRDHISLNPDTDRLFWQFSVDEMGLYDIPAFVDYVLHITGAPQLNYIGFSQGGGTFMIMCSERPGYCDKAGLLIGLSPATRQFYTRSLAFRLITKTVNEFREPIEELGIWEILTKGFPVQVTLNFLCQNRFLTEAVCGTVLAIVDAPHPGSTNSETLLSGFSHAPAGISTKNAARYGQALSNKKFVKFDYGRKNNLDIYGTPTPPEYNLTAVTVPTVVIQGVNDGIVDIRDSSWAAKQLPNLLEYVKVSDPLWTHFDQITSQYVSETTFPTIRQYLQQYSY